MMFSFSGKKTSKVLLPGLYYFAEGEMLDCNIYMLVQSSGGKKETTSLCLIDTGNGISFRGFQDSLTSLGYSLSQITQVLITHEHLDHIFGLYQLVETLQTLNVDKSYPSLQIFAHPKTTEILRSGDERKICPPELGISAHHLGITIHPLENIHSLPDQDTFSFGEWHFQVLDTPGHSLGSISFYDPSQHLLFPGDVVFPSGSFGRYDLPGGSLTKLKTSIQRLTTLNVQWLCAGHMPPVHQQAQDHLQASYQNILTLNF